MVSSSHWVGIVAGSQTESPTPQPQPSEARIPTKSGKRKAKVALEDSKSKESEMAMVSVADSSGKSQPSSGSVQDGEDKLVEREPDDSHPSKTRFRLRGKKSPAHLFQVSTSEVVENMTMERISAGEEVSTTYIKHLILFLAEIWNETIETIGTMLQTKGLDYLKEHDEELAEMSQAEMDCVFQKMVERQEELLAPIHLTETDGALAVRTYISKTAVEKGVHGRLIANADQVWSLLFRPNKKCLQKAASAKGLRSDPVMKSKLMRQIRHNIERALDIPFSEPDPGAFTHKTELKPIQITGGPAATAVVDEWRLPRTVTTLSFRDGYLGRAYITVRSGSLPEKTREQLNTNLQKFIFIAPPQEKTHVWSRVTFIKYLTFLAEEFRIRRRMLGLTAKDRGLIMLDQAGAHMGRLYERIQHNWSVQHNIVTWPLHLVGETHT
ncbi:Malate dehydrogenase 2 [Durusdinium trenchii]|uniref:Mitochondrial n=1 Tax=Durusdinium trenchii TaxID=1381693 RepID=A0ABP0IHK6_9DINO